MCDKQSKAKLDPKVLPPSLPSPVSPLPSKQNGLPATLEDSTHSVTSLCLLDMFLRPSSPLRPSVCISREFSAFSCPTCTITVFPHATVRTKLSELIRLSPMQESPANSHSFKGFLDNPIAFDCTRRSPSITPLPLLAIALTSRHFTYTYQLQPTCIHSNLAVPLHNVCSTSQTAHKISRL